MKYLRLAALLAALSIQSSCPAQTARHLAAHNQGKLFNQLAWKFDAEAPVRSTPLVLGNMVYLGSSRGVFYALDKAMGAVKWQFDTGSAINSSAAALNGAVYFTDNRQVLYAMAAGTGKLKWKTSLGQSKTYDWVFDYFYSSPTIANGKIYVGSKDGNLYCIDASNGSVKWRFATPGIIRSSPAVNGGAVYVGDTEGTLYALDAATGKQHWIFQTIGHGLKNTDFGFDRRAIISSPVVYQGKVIVGSRDGFFYAVDVKTGKELWHVDHKVSWVISTIAVKDSFAVTGTSDGRFVQAVNVNTGKEIWKFKTQSIVWSSAAISGDKVYIGSHEGILYCLDLKTGKQIDGFQTHGIIFSTPVIAGEKLFFGSDDGNIYALKPGIAPQERINSARYVYWEAASAFFRYGTDVRIRQYLAEHGYKVIGGDGLSILLTDSVHAAGSAVIFASNIFPDNITKGGAKSMLRNYLNHGGRVVVASNNPIVFKTAAGSKSIGLRSFLFADTVLNIKYGPDDLRSFKGNQPAFPNAIGKSLGLPKFWAAPLSLPVSQVDVVLGIDENGLASAWVKRYHPAKSSGFVQVWVDENTTNLEFLLHAAEWEIR